VVIQGKVHDRLVLPSAVLSNCSHWEKVPDLQLENSVLGGERPNFVSKHITPL
jgi:hypothetical protein